MECSALSNFRRPWWNVISTPFQSVCVLLSIDSRESLAVVPDAMAALRHVASVYDTSLAREALQTAYDLVRNSKQNKLDEGESLDVAIRDVGSGPAVEDPILDWTLSNDFFEALSEDCLGWSQFFSSGYVET